LADVTSRNILLFYEKKMKKVELGDLYFFILTAFVRELQNKTSKYKYYTNDTICQALKSRKAKSASDTPFQTWSKSLHFSKFL